MPLVQRLPKLFGHHRQSEPQEGHLDHDLIAGGNRPPVFRVLGVGAVDDSLQISRPQVGLAATDGQGNQAEQWPQQSLDAHTNRAVVGSGVPQLHASAARRKVRLERLGQSDGEGLQIMFTLEWRLHAF